MKDWKEWSRECFVNGEYYHLGYINAFGDKFYYRGIFEYLNGFRDNGYPFACTHYIHIPKPQDIDLTEK